MHPGQLPRAEFQIFFTGGGKAKEDPKTPLVSSGLSVWVPIKWAGGDDGGWGGLGCQPRLLPLKPSQIPEQGINHSSMVCSQSLSQTWINCYIFSRALSKTTAAAQLCGNVSCWWTLHNPPTHVTVRGGGGEASVEWSVADVISFFLFFFTPRLTGGSV